MQDERIPEIIFSDLCTEVDLDGHLLIVEIYRTEDDPWSAMLAAGSEITATARRGRRG